MRLSEAANNLRDRAFVLLLYESGARIGEVMSIHIKDVVFEQSGAEITIPTSKSQPRTIFVYRSAPAISNWLLDQTDRDNKNSFLFCGMWSKKRGEESDWATLTVTMPYSYIKPFPQLFGKLFQRFPNAFPLLRQLMGY